MMMDTRQAMIYALEEAAPPPAGENVRALLPDNLRMISRCSRGNFQDCLGSGKAVIA